MPQPILVAVDFSELTDRTLTYAVGLAAAQGVRLDLLHVASAGPPSRGLSHASAHDVLVQIQRTETEDSRRELEALMGRLVPEAQRGSCIVTSGTPAEAICEQAGKGYDLVVVSTRGRTGLSQILLGSVAERVVRLAPTPVLVVR